MPMPSIPAAMKEGAREFRANRDNEVNAVQEFQPSFRDNINSYIPNIDPQTGLEIPQGRIPNGSPMGATPEDAERREQQRVIEENAPQIVEKLSNMADATSNPLEYLQMMSEPKEDEVSLDNLSEKQKEKILKSFIKSRQIARNYYEDTIEPEILHRREVYYADKDHYKKVYPQLSELCGWVSRDVKTACDWLLPAFMEVFTGSDDPVSVKGVNIEDDKVAEKMQQLVRYQLEKKNNYHQWVMAEINDALKENFGIAKVWWEHEEKRTPMEMLLDQNDSNAVIALMSGVASGKIEITSVKPLKEAPDLAKVTYDIIKVTKNHPVVEYIPNSELRFTPDEPKLQDCKFVAHRKIVHGDYLFRKERDGLFQNVKKAVEEYTSGNLEPSVLDMDNDEARMDKKRQVKDDDLASKELELYEAYINVDYNDDGIYEKLIVHAVGDNLLRVVENDFEIPPFFVCSALTDANKVFSDESLPTNFEQIQDLKTAMIRQVIINTTKNNAPRTYINEQKVDMDALLNGEEVIPTIANPSECIFVPASLPLSSITMDLVNYAQNELEAQSGSTRYNQGLDSNSLNKTATGVTAIMGASEKRNKLLARSLAESFFIPVYKFIIKLNQLYLEDEQMIRLTNETLMIRKDELDIDYDLIINVGQGAGTKEAQIQYYMYMLNTIYPILAQQNVVNANSWYSLVKKLLETMGIRDVTPFLLDPESEEAKQAQQQAQQNALQAQAEQYQQAIQMAIAKQSIPRVSMNLTDMPAVAQQQYLEQTLGLDTTEQDIIEQAVLNK